MGTKPLVLPAWHIEICLLFAYLFVFYRLTKPSLLYCGNQTMFHPSTQLYSTLISIFQSVASISTSMQLSLGSPLGLCDYLLLDI